MALSLPLSNVNPHTDVARALRCNRVTDPLWKRFALGDEAARRDLLSAHLRLVYFVARRVAKGLNGEMEFDELVSAGTLGLVSAMDHFEPARGLAFSTFAAPRIRGSILDEIRRLDHVPRSVRRKSRHIGAATESLSRELNHSPTDAETAKRLDVDVETFWRWKSDVQGAVHVPIDAFGESDEGGSVAAVLAETDEEGPDDRLSHEQEVAMLRQALGALKERERVVLSLYYFEDLKLHEIAAILQLTESRVSQIRASALAQLREQLRPLREHVA